MYEILHRDHLTPVIHRYKIHAPDVARKAKAGQFVVIMLDEKGERFPLTIADWDLSEESVSIVFMETGKSTLKLATMKEGECLNAFTGPLGLPTEIENFGTVACVAGGFATAVIYPVARAMKQAGNRVTLIVGFRSKELMFWEDKLKSVSDELIIVTDDGTFGRKALVTEPLKELLETNKEVKRVVSIGPTAMMKFCSLTTKPFGVKTIVSLNPIMLDGTGMCGVCRVEVGGETRFACVDGPEFDGHLVDWNLLMTRQLIYQTEEKKSKELWTCRCGKNREVQHNA